MGAPPPRRGVRRWAGVHRHRHGVASGLRSQQRRPWPSGRSAPDAGRTGHDPDGGTGRVPQRRDGGGGAVLRGGPTAAGRRPRDGPIRLGEPHMSAVLDLFPDAVIGVDVDRRIMAANALASGLTGYRPGELVGRDAQEVLHPRGPGGHPVWDSDWHPSAYLPSVKRISRQEVTIRAASGREVRILVAGTYQRDPDGRLAGALVVLHSAGQWAHHPSAGIEIV